MKKRVLTIIFLAIAVAAFSQDFIIKKDGGRIDCKITKEDSANVYITIHLGETDVNANIKRKDIQSIGYGGNGQDKATNNVTTTKAFARNRIAFHLGAGIPESDYSSRNVNNANAGFANAGTNFNICYNHFYTPNIGLAIKDFSVTNPVDKEAMCNSISNSTGVKWTTDDDPSWDVSGLLFGLTFDFKDENDTHYEFNILNGPMGVTSPEVKFTTLSSNYSFIKQENATSNLNWGFDFGFGINRKISKRWDLMASIDYMICDFKFDEVKSSMFLNNSYYDLTTKNQSMNFQALNITIGFGYNFSVR
ncbi:MAG: hypothetical protein P4L28_08675 [Paludibacteraceae bacterium]|nr:hypothetical protein [Paludibacteraceae bacterium]